MNNNDRVRAISGVSEVYPQGATWGTMGSASQNATTAAGNNGISQAVGTGNVSALIGVVGVSFAVPDQGSLNAQYATGVWSQSGFNTGTATNRTASNVTYARLFSGAINSGGQANLAITNSIGLHTWPFWHANVSATTNRWAILNEDTTTTIQTAGNIVVTGNTQLQAYQETVTAPSFTGGAWTVNVNNGTIQDVTITSNITSLSFTNMPKGGSVTLIITQGGAGGFTLSSTGIKYAGGNSTLSTASGAIDILNVFFDGTYYYGSLNNGYV
jgi:hypothetical protein